MTHNVVIWAETDPPRGCGLNTVQEVGKASTHDTPLWCNLTMAASKSDFDAQPVQKLDAYMDSEASTEHSTFSEVHA